MLPKNLVCDTEHSPEDFAQLLDILETDARVQHERTTLEKLELRPDGTLSLPGMELRATQHFLECCAKAIGMPLSYAYKISPELFCENFQQRQAESTRPLTICTCGDAAIGLVVHKNAPYRPADTLAVLRELRDAPLFAGIACRRATVSPRGVDVEFVRQGMTVEPRPGDVVEVGIAVTNSETGGRQLKASAYSFRLLCTNGAVMRDALGLARWPNDSRMTEAACRAAFQQATRNLCARLDAVAKVYAGAAERQLPDLELWNLWRRIAYIIGQEDADQVVAISAQERHDLNVTIRGRDATEPVVMTGWNVYDMHNRVTHAAHGRNFLARRGLQEIGGDLLSRAIAWSPAASDN